jgi:hypothetical protein
VNAVKPISATSRRSLLRASTSSRLCRFTTALASAGQPVGTALSELKPDSWDFVLFLQARPAAQAKSEEGDCNMITVADYERAELDFSLREMKRAEGSTLQSTPS